MIAGPVTGANECAAVERMLCTAGRHAPAGRESCDVCAERGGFLHHGWTPALSCLTPLSPATA